MRARLRNNWWKVDRELADRRERERNSKLLPDYDQATADRRFNEGVERLRRSLERDKQTDNPPF